MNGLATQEISQKPRSTGAEWPSSPLIVQPEAGLVLPERAARGKGGISPSSLQPHSDLLPTNLLIMTLARGAEQPRGPVFIEQGGLLLTIFEKQFKAIEPDTRTSEVIIERAKRYMDRQLGPADLFADLLSVAEVGSVEEEEAHIYLSEVFAPEPIPRVRNPIRLTPQLRDRIPPEKLPDAFAIPLSEELED